MEKLVKVEARNGFKLYVEFDDGSRGEVDISRRLFGPMLEPLNDPDFFARVTLDAFGAPCWPNGADWAPDALYLAVNPDG